MPSVVAGRRPSHSPTSGRHAPPDGRHVDERVGVAPAWRPPRTRPRARWPRRRTAAPTRAGSRGTSCGSQRGEHALRSPRRRPRPGRRARRSPAAPRPSARPRARRRRARPRRRARRARRRRRGRSRRRRRTARVRTPERSTSSRTAWPLSTGTGGRISSTLRPQCVASPAVSASWASPSRWVRAAVLVGRAAPVEGDDRPLVLDPRRAVGRSSGVSRSRHEAPSPAPPSS